jgi:hypothetical protein
MSIMNASYHRYNAKDQRLTALGSAITHEDARESFASVGSVRAIAIVSSRIEDNRDHINAKQS